jgi:hypothetical protein
MGQQIGKFGYRNCYAFLNAIPKFRQWVTKLAAPKTNQEKRKAGRTNPLRKSDGR